MPFLPDVSNYTFIVPVFPGPTGLPEYFGIVQPQLATAELTIRSAVPVLLKENKHVAFSPAFTLPKSCSYSVKLITAFPVSLAADWLPLPLCVPVPHPTADMRNTSKL